MSIDTEFHIAVLPGDGIGQEVMPPALDLLERAASAGGFGLRFETLDAGADAYRRTCDALSDAVLDRVKAADAILLGAMGLPDVRYPDGREITPQIDLREWLVLYAGVRPVRTFPGLPVPLADPRAQHLDFVLIRESTEGLFSSRNTPNRTEDEATDTLKITRAACERLFRYTFELAEIRQAAGRPGRVTCVDKANVLSSMGFFRDLFEAEAVTHTGLATDSVYVDAMALTFLRNPWDLDVLVTENMFGDILSDAGAGLMGGLGFAPSADIGEKHAVFQPCHGTAPDIAGQGKANPTAMILSAAMMLDWLGHRHGLKAAVDAGRAIEMAVEAAFATGVLHPMETGGGSNLRDIANAVTQALSA
jgi:3-isopropylmalate dehydrogenase